MEESGATSCPRCGAGVEEIMTMASADPVAVICSAGCGWQVTARLVDLDDPVDLRDGPSTVDGGPS